MAMQRSWHRWITSLFLLLPLCAGSSSQSQPASPANSASVGASQQAQVQSPASQGTASQGPATVLKTTTRLVVVDVVATDKKGAAVADLTADDFQLMEDGKEQKVRAFNFQHPEQHPEAAASTKSTSQAATGILTNVPSFTGHSALNVFLIDGLNTTVTNQLYVHEQMIKFLQKLPPNEPLAVYLLGSKLTLLQDFTSDPTVLQSVLRNLKEQKSPVLDDPTEELFAPGVFDSLPGQMQQSIEAFEAESTAAKMDVRIQLTLDVLNSLARTLSGYPGRKNLIWLSESFPLSINPDTSLGVHAFDTMRDYSPLVAKTADALTTAQVSVYPVDAHGLAGHAAFSAESSGRDKLGRNAMTSQRVNGTLSQDSDQSTAAHSAMNELADRTGGKAFYNGNDLDNAIGKSIEDGSTYYTLGYYPDNKDWDGKFRKIQVKSLRSGIKLRYRLGYFATDPASYEKQKPEQKNRDLAMSLSLDYPAATGLPFRASVLQPSEKTQNKAAVNFAVDAHSVSFDSQADGLQHASVTCAVEAYSAKGKVIKAEAHSVSGALTAEQVAAVMKSGFPCQQLIDLPAGSYILRIGVRDEHTGVIGTLTTKTTVGQSNTSAAKAGESNGANKAEEKKQ
ncbi:MAG TPA: VWA domain-containing protein [Candidatus Angelobacter sp.]|nr:VWA domain-containing protein [Candidatus Angelobacter sp.]